MVRKGNTPSHNSSSSSSNGGGAKQKKMKDTVADKVDSPTRTTTDAEAGADSETLPMNSVNSSLAGGAEDVNSVAASELAQNLVPKPLPKKGDSKKPASKTTTTTNNNNNEDDSDTVLEVQCGLNKAHIYLTRLRQGSRGPCVFFDEAWFTPNEFQQVSGRETAKDWKRSIKHHGKSLKLLMAKGTLTLQPPKCLCEECTGIPDEESSGKPATSTTGVGSPLENKKDEKPSTANKESSSNNSNSSAPIDREGGNIGNLSDDAEGGKPAQKKRGGSGGGGNKKRRNKQKESIDSEAAAAFLPPKTDASQTDEKSTGVAVAATESTSAAGRNYDPAKDQDLSNDACKVSSSPAPVAAFTRGEDDRSERSSSFGIDIGSEVESRLSNYGFKPKAPPTTTNRNGDDADDVDDEENDDDEASENTSVRARGRLVVLPTKSQPHESVKVKVNSNSAIAEHDAMDTDGHGVMREETERQGELGVGASELLGRREINESITAENREGRDREETGFKHDDKPSSAAPRAAITYADARASFSDESLTAWQGKAAIDEKEEAVTAADGSELLQTKMEPGLMYSAKTTLGDNDLALALVQDGGASGRANNSHKDTINSFYPSRDMIDAHDSKLFSGRRQLGLLLTDGGNDDVTRRAAAAVLPPGEIKDNAMILKTEIESKAGCGRRLEFSSEQRRHDSGRSPDMQSGVDVRPLQNNGSSPDKEARLIDIIHELRSYKKQIIQRIEYQRHTPDDEDEDDETKEGLSSEIKRARSVQPEAVWRTGSGSGSGAGADSDRCDARRESKSAPNLTQPMPADWTWEKLHRSSSTEILSGGGDRSYSRPTRGDLPTDVREKSQGPAPASTASPAVLTPRVSTFSAVNYVSPIPRSSLATSNGHLYSSLVPGASSTGAKSATRDARTKSSSPSSSTSLSPSPAAHSTPTGLSKGTAATTVTTSSANIPRVSPYYWHPGSMRVPYYPSLYPGMTSSDYYSYMQGAGLAAAKPEQSNSGSDRRSLPKFEPSPTYDKCGALDLSTKKRKSDSYLVAAESKKQRRADSHKRVGKGKRLQEGPMDLSVKNDPEVHNPSRKHNGALPVSSAHSSSVAAAAALGQYMLPVSAGSALTQLTPSLLGSLSPGQATDPSTAMSMYQLYLYNMYNHQMAARQKKVSSGKVSST